MPNTPNTPNTPNGPDDTPTPHGADGTMQGPREFVEAYFAAAKGPDRERHLSLFDERAVVHDEGRSHEGLAAVRRWRDEVPPVRYDLREVTGTPADFRALAEVAGDFPGSPVTLCFTFERDEQGRITRLEITP
ncbi:nuclear transport factor 2 family protein [Streptomyces sp. NPDC056628]|uniref:nuclear transport factor 2 family protein n=1 Tax=Streptomyces sp. NPDC056628 TaxID=3345882 RepID=UPI0036916CA1